MSEAEYLFIKSHWDFSFVRMAYSPPLPVFFFSKNRFLAVPSILGRVRIREWNGPVLFLKIVFKGENMKEKKKTT